MLCVDAFVGGERRKMKRLFSSCLMIVLLIIIGTFNTSEVDANTGDPCYFISDISIVGEIFSNECMTSSITSRGEIQWYTFTPADGGYYSFSQEYGGELSIKVTPYQLVGEELVATEYCWTNDDDEYLTVTEASLVAGETYFISVKADKDWHIGRYSLDTRRSATTVKLNKSSFTLYKKGTSSVKATVFNPLGKTVFEVDDSSVAKVSSSGKVTAVKAGTTYVRAWNNGVSKRCKVTVKNPYLKKKSKTIEKGSKYTIKIVGKVGKAKYSTSNRKVAAVSSSGKVTAKKKGKAKITVKTNGIKLTFSVKVINQRPDFTATIKDVDCTNSGKSFVKIRVKNYSKTPLYVKAKGTYRDYTDPKYKVKTKKGKTIKIKGKKSKTIVFYNYGKYDIWNHAGRKDPDIFAFLESDLRFKVKFKGNTFSAHTYWLEDGDDYYNCSEVNGVESRKAYR